MTISRTILAVGGHVDVRRLRRRVVVLLSVLLTSGALILSAAQDHVDVSEKDGVYQVTARFEVPQTLAVAQAVLTDYERMPTFMPKLRSSVIRERHPGHILVEQELNARWFLFSKQIHLCLEVIETPGAIRFKDTAGESFSQYVGEWTLTTLDGRTAIAYTLTAKPTFSVPGFMISKLMKSDADDMIDGLRKEMARR